jgi:4a-hydroxytetrahydrobiopterin dehydratase
VDNLVQEKCVACRKDSVPVTKELLADLLPRVPEWKLMERDGVEQLERIFKFADYVEALTFTNSVARLAESEGHHPIILLEWGKVTVTWWTHAINALHRNDFIMAAKTDALLEMNEESVE